jgi:hypothetical protein
MNSVPLSQWRTSFAAVLFETDKSQIRSRITDALAAIDERLRSVAEVGGVERKSIEIAQRSLASMARGLETSSAPEPKLEKADSELEASPALEAEPVGNTDRKQLKPILPIVES